MGGRGLRRGTGGERESRGGKKRRRAGEKKKRAGGGFVGPYPAGGPSRLAHECNW